MAMRMKPGPEVVSLEQTEEGYRTIKAKYLVYVTEGETVFQVLNCDDLPKPGSIWQEGSDVDPDVFCNLETTVGLFKDKNYTWYEVVRTFTNKPGPDVCPIDYTRKDPLAEPPKVSGRFTKFTEEATVDKDGAPLLSSSGEQLRGPAVEFDDSRFSVRVEQNVYPLHLPTLYSHKDVVNDRDLWGFPKRSIKVSAITFDRKFYGPPHVTGSGTGTGTVETCRVYYARTVELDVYVKRDPTDPNNPAKFTSGHDRIIPDEGAMVWNGDWDKNKNSPRFRYWVLKQAPPGNDIHEHPTAVQLCKYHDWKGNEMRAQLNGTALPVNVNYAFPLAGGGYATGFSGPQAKIVVKKYVEADLVADLGLPAVIEL